MVPFIISSDFQKKGLVNKEDSVLLYYGNRFISITIRTSALTLALFEVKKPFVLTFGVQAVIMSF